MTLQLPLKSKWFNLTKEGTKKEDYREITPYWCSRLLTQNGKKETQKFWEQYLKTYGEMILYVVVKNYDATHRIKPKVFESNLMTLGYPKKDDYSKFLKYKHEGIEIGEGEKEWGAEPGKLYFIIKHGEIKNNDN